ncbi:hypothetical protein LTR94_031655, partial [Friedmanniomyces endolithicus]
RLCGRRARRQAGQPAGGAVVQGFRQEGDGRVQRLRLHPHAVGSLGRPDDTLRRNQATGMARAAVAGHRGRLPGHRAARRLHRARRLRRDRGREAAPARRRVPQAGQDEGRPPAPVLPRRQGNLGRGLGRRPPAPDGGRQVEGGSPSGRGRLAVRADRAAEGAPGGGDAGAAGAGFAAGLGHVQHGLRA